MKIIIRNRFYGGDKVIGQRNDTLNLNRNLSRLELFEKLLLNIKSIKRLI